MQSLCFLCNGRITISDLRKRAFFLRHPVLEQKLEKIERVEQNHATDLNSRFRVLFRRKQHQKTLELI